MRKTSTIKIGKKIQAIRKSYGYTQEMLAEIIEVSVRYISEIEQDRAKPSYEVLVKICNLFNVSIDKLSKKDKNTIENLIMYFNKSKSNDL